MRLPGDTHELIRAMDAEARPHTVYCIGCGYDLTGGGTHCPECGRYFSAEDPSTTLPTRTARSWRKWATAPAFWWAPALAVFCAWGALESSAPGPAAPHFALCRVCVWVVLVLVFGTKAAARFGDRRRAAQDRVARPRRVSRWIIAPALLVLCEVLLWQRPTLHMRFALSRDALERHVASGAPSSSNDQWVGWFWVYATVRSADGSVSFVTNFWSSPSFGVQYRPVDSAAGWRETRLAAHWFEAPLVGVPVRW